MHELMVSLDIVSKTMPLVELATALGLEGSASSHSLGDKRHKDRRWDVTIWRMESSLNRTMPLSAHLDQIITVAQSAQLFEKLNRLIPRVQAILSIGIVTDAVATSLAIKPLHLRFIASNEIEIELTFYAGQ